MQGVLGEAYVVDKVILKRSIMSCSFVVLTGAGGLGSANALHGTEVDAAGMDEFVVPLLLIDDRPSVVSVP